MVAGLIPFETEDMTYVFLVSVTLNFLVYVGFLYCVLLIRARLRFNNA